MQDTSEIVAQLDLAPPTKRLMRMKETGGLDKLFTLPCRSISSRILQRLFSRNLRTQPINDAIGQDVTASLLAPDESRPHVFFRPTCSGPVASAIEDQLLSAAATPRVGCTFDIKLHCQIVKALLWADWYGGSKHFDGSR